MISFVLNFQVEDLKKQIHFSDLIAFDFKNSFPAASLSFSLKKSMHLTAFLDGFSSLKKPSALKKNAKSFFMKVSFFLDQKNTQASFQFSGWLIRFIEKKNRYIFYALDESVLLFSAFYQNFSFSSFIDLEMALSKSGIPLSFHSSSEDFFMDKKYKVLRFYKKSLMEIFLNLALSLDFFFYIKDSLIFIIPKKIKDQNEINSYLRFIKEDLIEYFFYLNPPLNKFLSDFYLKNKDAFFLEASLKKDFYIDLYRLFEFQYKNKTYKAQLLDYQASYHIEKDFSVSLKAILINK